ncbi:hypothetical protein SAMN05216241_104100 [Limimonas halophila]|uniref:Sulfotransferase family protein n=1 Tax=Limimonas halophila TaxID=1082479 RepID=A0A1G7QQ54_9PROT|nr:hypothetical protein [Limimonas halophila]SDG00655.1 hypothetical protein SAMN05216241_104100 [Limimonas halophila]
MTDSDTPIVHIGYHKTASTWFQTAFYPACKGAHLVTRRNTRQAFLEPTALAFDPAEARRTLAVPAGMRPVVCEEALVGYYGNAGLLQALSKDVAYRVRDVFPDAQVVIFIRNQLDMLAATYLQYIRRGGTHTVRRFLYPYRHVRRYRTKAFKNPMFCLEHLDYHNLIQHYINIFGREKVHVFPYEAFRTNAGDFLKTYAALLGLDVDVDALSFSGTNVSYRMTTARLARLLNHVTVGDAPDSITPLPLMPRKVNEVAMRQVNRTPLAGPKVTPERLFGREHARELAVRYAPGNRVLTEMLDVDLAGYGYPVAAAGQSAVSDAA